MKDKKVYNHVNIFFSFKKYNKNKKYLNLIHLKFTLHCFLIKF